MRHYELSIRPFRQVACDKEQALKPLEEAAEIVDNSRYDPGTYFVGCLYCGARSDYEHGEENAAELWNGRVNDEVGE